MANKLQVLVLAMLSIAALSTVGASSAQAGAFDIYANPAVITGHSDAKPGGGFQEHVFALHTTGGGVPQIKCPTASFEGTSHQVIGGITPIPQVVNHLTLTPTYGPGCIGFGGMPAQILMNGCKYTLTGAGQPAGTFLVDVTGCTAGKSMEIKTAVCTLDVLQHHQIPHVVGQTIITEGQPQEVTLETTLRFTVLQTGLGCPDGNNHLSTNLTLGGNTVLKAFQDVGQVLVNKHGHEYFEALEGAPVPLTAT